MLKYIVWGTGQRGLKALEILGKERIAYFVDGDKNKIGNVINGIKVESTEFLRTHSENNIILVTPVNYSTEIVRQLKEWNNYNYFIFDDHPAAFDLSQYGISHKYIARIIYDLSGRVFLCGINWFNLYLYDILKEHCLETMIYVDNNYSDKLVKVIEKEYNLSYGKVDLSSADYVLSTQYIGGFNKTNFIDLEKYLEKTYPIIDKRLESFKNIHNGEKCFIIATGPSLKISDLENLKKHGIKCISMNRIYNIFDKTEWRPDYYVIEDNEMIEDLANEILNIPLAYKFVRSGVKKYWQQPGSEMAMPIQMIQQNCTSDNVRFSDDFARYVYEGFTVTYACLQLAVYMGFSEIYLLGVDFNYSEDVYAESNHFEGYQSHYKDIRLNPIMPDRMLRAYKKANELSQDFGCKIYNATRGGKLEVFERVDMDSLFL